MSPHVDDLEMPSEEFKGTNGLDGIRNGSYSDHHDNHTFYDDAMRPLSATAGVNSYLEQTHPEEMHDLVCVGFGPASLAIAVALHDFLEQSKAPAELSSLRGRSPKVVFLEKQKQFAWHAGMLLPGAKMQITFLKDMASLRNPRSEFTFINYLFKHDRLVQFTNLDTFLPQRIEYEDYMRWCAQHFDNVVEYAQEGLEVLPEKSDRNSAQIDSFVVKSRDTGTGEVTARRARHVVIAVGGRPSFPKAFPANHPRVIHSSQYTSAVPNVLKETLYPYSVAVVGAGQSAAEIFDTIHSQYPNSKTRLLIRGSALRPSDDSPFVNEIFNPSSVDDVYHQSPELRATALAADRATNYGVVRLTLLEKIYSTLYTQRIRLGPEEEKWPHRILSHRNVNQVEDSPVIPGGVRLHMSNRSGDFQCNACNVDDEVLDVDLVLVASGYSRDAHEGLLRGAQWLKPAHDEDKWTVQRNYRVKFTEGRVSNDAGVWLQGCCENTHGVSYNTLLVTDFFEWQHEFNFVIA
ncbi:L-ornithine N5 oxygenase [Lineolata rhizophorae]|uniref:L-ornithine N(5)-monooxygenase [NAD(P)H] n=1 Tax=Lineolata rhizophorae TaxID=578093 RepID=A0A6A6P1S8_9PEZI|nr:L-ornithine N5 oxygenase [Lineolata rhizophorae]